MKYDLATVCFMKICLLLDLAVRLQEETQDISDGVRQPFV